MAEVKAFRALRYNLSKESSLATRIAPPYDTISRTKNSELRKRHPHNVIKLILGDPSTLTPAEKKDMTKYDDASKALNDWTSADILTTDPEPSIYLLEESFLWNGERKTRTGLLLLTKLEELGKGRVLPHERTLAMPIEDRLHLMLATRTQLSPIFMTFDDSDRSIRKELTLDPRWELLSEFDNPDDSIHHRFFRTHDANLIHSLTKSLSDRPFLIADGHHRYSTAFHFRQNHAQPGDDSAWVLTYLAPSPDPGLVLSSIHRVLDSSLAPSDLESRLASAFEFKTCKSTWEDFISSKAPLGLVDGNSLRLLIPKPDTLKQIHLDLREVPSVILNEAVIRSIFGLDLSKPQDQGKVHFVKSFQEVLGAKGLGFVLRPLSPLQVLEVAREGHVLPQKSTFFYPKVMAGFVFHPLD